MPGSGEDLQDQIAQLRRRVDALAGEVRTRRLAVVDAAGHPRIVLGADPGVASVRVQVAEGDPSIELYAVDAIEADGPELGLAVVAGGDVVRSWHELQPGPP